MNLSEVLEKLNAVYKEQGDIKVQVDHKFFETTLDIDSIEVGDTYIGPHAPILYIYVDSSDASALLDR